MESTLNAVSFTREESHENAPSLRDTALQSSVSGGVSLLIIDPQNDFHPGGSLAIPSSGEDATRIATFIRTRNIDRIFITLDSHQRMHIAHGIFWVDDDGHHPPPFTTISHEDVRTRKWRARDPKHQRAVEHYAQQLDERGRFQICIWPEHCIMGSPGHNVHPEILAAVGEWAESRMKEVVFVWKGQNCLTEMYSALRAEVPVEDPQTHLNTELIRTLRESRRLFVCGQALSHCVNFTVRDLVEHYDESRLASITILRDGTSSVPGFEAECDCFLRDMARKGVVIEHIEHTGHTMAQ
jgi:nicotinamidase/pyrazinamidase